MRLLTISFDPVHDTPKVLRAYGGSFEDVAGKIPFDRWEFAVPPSQADLKKVADYFGLFFTDDGGQIVHSLSTTVISPEGTVYKWYEDNQWTPKDLVADASAALQEGKQLDGRGEIRSGERRTARELDVATPRSQFSRSRMKSGTARSARRYSVSGSSSRQAFARFT